MQLVSTTLNDSSLKASTSRSHLALYASLKRYSPLKGTRVPGEVAKFVAVSGKLQGEHLVCQKMRKS